MQLHICMTIYIYIGQKGEDQLLLKTFSQLFLYTSCSYLLFKRDFLQEDHLEGKKIHLVSWLTVCLNKKVGGLGIIKLATLNKVLLGKRLWRFVNEKDRLWRKVVKGKFGEIEGDWVAQEVRGWN